MATHHGKEGVVKIGANTLAEVNGWSLETSVALDDDSELSDDWATHKVGIKTWNGQLECHWDETDTNGQVALTEGAEVTVNLYPEGAGSGAAYFSGTATIQQISYAGAKGAIVSAAFTFMGNGALTRPTVT